MNIICYFIQEISLLKCFPMFAKMSHTQSIIRKNSTHLSSMFVFVIKRRNSMSVLRSSYFFMLRCKPVSMSVKYVKAYRKRTFFYRISLYINIYIKKKFFFLLHTFSIVKQYEIFQPLQDFSDE